MGEFWDITKMLVYVASPWSWLGIGYVVGVVHSDIWYQLKRYQKGLDHE